MRERDKQTQRGDVASAYSLGLELACAVAGFVLVGVWIDRHYSSGPWGTLICFVLGLIGGFYNLYRGMSRLSGGPAKRPRAIDPQPDTEAAHGIDGADRPGSTGAKE